TERCVTRKTELCARVGACNTFWTEDGALVGDNTDVAGVLAGLDRLGAAVAAADRQVELHVLSRDAGRAQRFAEWARTRGARAQPARQGLVPDVAINATPLGLRDSDPLPFDAAHAPPERLRAALDLV